MKKIITRLIICLSLGFLACFILALCIPLPKDILPTYLFLYKFCSSIEYYTYFMPIILLTAFVVNASVIFGQNSQGSTKRFSIAMGKRYKFVMITAIICTVIVLLFSEMFCVFAKNKKQEIANRPHLINEYIKVGNSLYEKGLYQRAIQYANAVLDLDANSSQARDLISKSNMEINRIDSADLRHGILNSEILVEMEDKLLIDSEKLKNSFDYYNQAKKAFDEKKWFDAHYYAEIALKLVTSKDPNLDKIKAISCEAWNNLTEEYQVAKTEREIFFEQKFNGYKALVQKDDLQAYYIFRYLYENYPEMQQDPDVAFYFEVAKERVAQKYFYVDETFELENFEEANDIYFSYTKADGSTDIIFFKGVSSVKATGQTIQYLRDFTITTIDRYGKFVRKMHTPYAKLMPISVKSINDATKTMLEIPKKAKFVPYLLLKSVGRDDPNMTYIPRYTYKNGETSTTPEFIILPIDYSDFRLVEYSKNNPKLVPIFTLFELTEKATDFGFSQEQYGISLLNRLFYPLLLIFLFVMFASFVWDNRIGLNQYFKFSWVFAYPLISVILILVIQFFTFIQKIGNTVIMIMSPNLITAVIVSLACHVSLILFVSIYFLSRKSS